MKNLIYSFCFVLLVFASISAINRPVHVFMAGDSTMADKPFFKNVKDSLSGDSIPVPFLERGWGQMLPDFLNENVIVKNYAQNGRSSRTFIEQEWWNKIVSEVQTGDYVIIQFGHNDSAEDKPDRYTSPKEYTQNISRFIDEVKAKGANPIICTSVVRRRFDKDKNFIDSHGIYISLAIEVAKEKGVPLIDMYKKSKDLLIKLGENKSIDLFLHIQPKENSLFPDGKIDNTHFREKGASMMAALFIEGIKEENIKTLMNELK